MSMVTDLLQDLLIQGAELSIEDGGLRVRAPEGVLPPEKMEVLRRHKDELLLLLPEYRFEAPLSVGQEGLWFIQKSAPDSSAYNVGLALRIESERDPAPALRRALQKLVNRHALLRTTFAAVDGSPRQVVRAYCTVDLPEIDATLLSSEQILSAASAVHLRPFDLEAEGAFRACLFRSGPNESLLMLCVHHVAVDGWSLRMMLDELLRLYETDGQANPLPPVNRTYQQFVRWQREMLASRGEELRRYWVDELEGAPLVLDLPTDRARPPFQTFRGAALHRTLAPALVDGLRALARAQSATLYTIFLTAFQVLLHRYSGQEDFCVGSAAASREREEFTETFGYLVNAIVLRAQLSATEPQSFLSLLQQTRKRLLGALDRQEYPFPLLAKELLHDRDPSRPPVFQVMFSYQRAQRLSDSAIKLMGGAPVAIGGARFSAVPLAQEISEVDLILEVTEHPTSLDLGIRYNSDLFDAGTIERMAEHFEVLLGGIVSDPGRPISALPLLSSREREQVLVDWNRTEVPFSSEACIHELFEAQVDRTPDAVAIVDFCGRAAGSRGAPITYLELDRRANQVAHRLRRLGVGPEVLVGLCMDRSTDLIVGLLGILKAGGAYTVLDPEHPRRRLSFVLEDTGVPVVLTQTSLLSSLPETQARVVDFDQGFEGEPEHRPKGGAGPGNLVYVLYTSGSTGEPNGAMIEHRGLCNVVESTIPLMGIGPASRLAHVTAFNFDGASGPLFWMLIVGGTVCLAPRGGDYLGKGLVDLMEREATTHIFLVPAMLSTLPEAELPSMRGLAIGGERVSAELVARWGRGGRFVCIYGPTEVTVFSTAAPRCVADGRDPSIGRPLGNYRAYILDRWEQPVPPGVVGELYLGGVGVGRGYLNRPALTAEKFIKNPFGEGRLYRTGDMVRYRMTDGVPPVIDFVGRVDTQIKLRGYRIELGEIESTLRASPDVREALVTLWESGAAQGAPPRIVAYVTPRSRERSKVMEIEQVASWERTYDELVAPSAGPAASDVTLDLRGWKSSYTGDDIPAEQMRVWAESTVARILDLAPQEVLEVGCGTGMLLARVAPRARRYRGTDLSRYALDQVQVLKAQIAGLENVHVSQQPAHDFTGLTGDRFDTILLNSVVQYFPSADYLFKVIEGLLALIRPEGSIFLGDIRHLALLETYHASVERYRADAATPRRVLRGRVQRAIVNDNELVLHPRFFTALRAVFPQIVDVEIVPKRGAFKNELSLFRYDVTLRIGAQLPAPASIVWRDARAEGMTLDDLRAWIVGAGPGQILGLRDVPNARLREENDLTRWLAGDDDDTLAPWQPPPPDPRAWDPEALYALETELSCRVRLSWAAGRPDGSLDAIVTTGDVAPPRFPLEPPVAPSRWDDLASDPLQGRAHRELATDLRRELREALPQHLIPSSIVVLPALPLTINGKVDTRALPPPEIQRDPAAELVEPRTDEERKLAEVWCRVLGLARVGVDDNFFALGGDSLLAVQVMARLPALFGLELPVRVLLEAPTIDALARHVEITRATQRLAPDRPKARADHRDSGRI